MKIMPQPQVSNKIELKQLKPLKYPKVNETINNSSTEFITNVPLKSQKSKISFFDTDTDSTVKIKPSIKPPNTKK